MPLASCPGGSVLSRRSASRPPSGSRSAVTAVGIERDAGPHRGAHRQALDVVALGRRRLGAHQLAQERARVLEQLVLAERRLADRRVDVGALVDAELDLARLELLDRLRDVERHRAALRVRHQPARTRARGRACRPRPSGRAWRRSRRRRASRPGSSSRTRRSRRSRRRRPGLPSPSRPCASTSTRRLLPVPCGSTTVPRTSWSEWRGSTPRWDETTIVSSNLARAVCFTSLHGLGQLPHRAGLLGELRGRAITLAVLHESSRGPSVADTAVTPTRLRSTPPRTAPDRGAVESCVGETRAPSQVGVSRSLLRPLRARPRWRSLP